MRYRALIFDFDGTIADTLGETWRIFNEIAPDYGIRRVEEDELFDLRHLSIKELLSRLKIPKRRVPLLLARGTSMMRSGIAEMKLIDGMGDVVKKLRSRVEDFGILTSNATANVELFLESHGLRQEFDFISSTSKLTGKAKHLKAIRKTFSLNSEDMLFVGDELRDVKAAKKAKIPIAAVTWGFNSLESLQAGKPDYLLKKPEEFLKLMG